MQDILINWAPQETRVAIVENGAVQELHSSARSSAAWSATSTLGKVARVLPGMQSAFIDIGLERAAFLHVADVCTSSGGTPRDDAPQRRAPTPIERLVFEGQTLTVQVIKDPIGTKGARLSTQISDRRPAARLPAAGRPHRHLAEDRLARAARAAARAHDGARQAAGENGAAGRGGGFILRTNAAEATDAELADDIALPAQDLGRACASARFKSPPGTLLHQDLSLAERVLRDLADEHTQSIRIDSRLQFETLLAVRPRVHAELGRQAAALRRASGRSSTSTTSTRRSRGRSRGAST